MSGARRERADIERASAMASRSATNGLRTDGRTARYDERARQQRQEESPLTTRKTNYCLASVGGEDSARWTHRQTSNHVILQRVMSQCPVVDDDDDG